MGGAGENIERRFGRFVNGIFDPLANLGGTLRQLFSVGNFNNPNLPASSRGLCQPGNPTLCCIPVEVDPPQATVRNVGRLTTPVFGAGLIEEIPDAAIVANLQTEHPRRAAMGIGGKPNRQGPGRANTSSNDGSITRFRRQARRPRNILTRGLLCYTASITKKQREHFRRLPSSTRSRRCRYGA